MKEKKKIDPVEYAVWGCLSSAVAYLIGSALVGIGSLYVVYLFVKFLIANT